MNIDTQLLLIRIEILIKKNNGKQNKTAKKSASGLARYDASGTIPEILLLTQF